MTDTLHAPHIGEPENRAQVRQAFTLPSLCDETDGNRVTAGDRTVVLYLNGDKVRGRLRCVPESIETLELHLEDDDRSVAVTLRDIKLLYLPASRPWKNLKPESGQQLLANPEPQEFVVDFCDGDRFKGRTFGFNADRHGLYLYPVQKEGTFFYVFIPHHAVKDHQIGPKIGQQLVIDHAVTSTHVASALADQQSQRSRLLGEYLLHNAVVTANELEEALQRQHSMPNIRLGEMLIQENLITAEQLDLALEAQRTDRSQQLGAILIEQGHLSPEQLQRSLAKKLGIPFVDLDHFVLDENALTRVPEELARQHTVLPLHFYGGKLVVALNNPLDWKVLEAVRFAAGLDVIPVMAPVEKIRESINSYYAGAVMDDPELDQQIQQAEQEEEDWEEAGESNNVVIRLANKIVFDAYHAGASDIHIEPYSRQETRIRIRKDGTLAGYRTIPSGLRRALISRYKVMAGLNVAERRVPQDGKIEFRRFSRLDIELRIATIPTAGGEEDMVIRVLAGGKAKPIGDILLAAENERRVKRMLDAPHGMLFVCGPTGSGKTTTLHSMLSYLNTPERKIWTVEDPVEITQEGLRQVQLQPKVGLDFASALRAFLRADPDVIMVGEMRDEETTSIGIEASLTGHLVLSTLHTNSAVESVVRLLEIGMDPYNFADALLGVLSQRLVKRLCPDCKKAVEAGQAEIDRLAEEYCYDSGIVADEQFRRANSAAAVLERWHERYAGQSGRFVLYEPQGCRRCDSTGYSGRIAVHEVMISSERIRHAIFHRATARELAALALEEGMRTLRQDGIEKILQGHTDLIQLRKVCAA